MDPRTESEGEGFAEGAGAVGGGGGAERETPTLPRAAKGRARATPMLPQAFGRGAAEDALVGDGAGSPGGQKISSKPCWISSSLERTTSPDMAPGVA